MSAVSGTKRNKSNEDGHKRQNTEHKSDSSQGSSKKGASKQQKKQHYRQHAQAPKAGTLCCGAQAGLLASCCVGKDAQARKELYTMLDQIFEQDDTNKDSSTTTTTTETVSNVESSGSFAAQLATEVKDMKQHTKRFRSLYIDVKGNVYIVLPDGSDVVELCRKLYNMTSGDDAINARFTTRCVPVQVVVEAKVHSIVDAFKKLIVKLVEQHEEETLSKKKFAILYRSRHNSQLERATVIESVAKLMPTSVGVDLKNFDIALIVEVVKSVACVSLIADMTGFRAKFRLHQDPTS